MKKVFEWVKGMAMVAVAIALIGGEALFWKAWEATASGIRWLWRQTKATVGLALREETLVALRREERKPRATILLLAAA